MHVLGYRISLNYQKEGKQKRDTKVIEFPTIYQKTKGPKYIHGELEFSRKADNYPFIKKAIST